jgi:hypothetical protein
MTALTYFLYNNIPGCWHGWTLAVLATGQADADLYVKNYNRGGKRAGKVTSGTVNADCGAVTEAAQAVLGAKSDSMAGEL